MSMFDVIRLERDLPDDGNVESEYRTNDLKNAGFRYHLTYDGRLERFFPMFEVEPQEKVEMLTNYYTRVKHFVRERVPHHGFLTFYSNERMYTANFSYGMLIEIRPGGREVWLPSEEGGYIDPWGLLIEIKAALSRLESPTAETRIILRSINTALGPTYRKSATE